MRFSGDLDFDPCDATKVRVVFWHIRCAICSIASLDMRTEWIVPLEQSTSLCLTQRTGVHALRPGDGEVHLCPLSNRKGNVRWFRCGRRTSSPSAPSAA